MGRRQAIAVSQKTCHYFVDFAACGEQEAYQCDAHSLFLHRLLQNQPDMKTKTSSRWLKSIIHPFLTAWRDFYHSHPRM